jgi:hypothetical protein
MSFLNQAYQTLKNPEALRDYLLSVEGVSAPAKGQLPIELAEGWFELQDLMMEDRDAARARMPAFEAELGGFLDRSEQNLLSLERSYDENPAQDKKEKLETLAREIQARQYLKSLERDIGRFKNVDSGRIHR